MSDKELLELAAKAAGVKWIDHCFDYDEFGRMMLDFGEGVTEWNPLTSDGDALRLAVKLGIQIQIYLPTGRDGGQTFTYSQILLGYGITNFPSYQAGEIFSEHHNDDPYAATLRAVVRAAAEMGKLMEAGL